MSRSFRAILICVMVLPMLLSSSPVQAAEINSAGRVVRATEIDGDRTEAQVVFLAGYVCGSNGRQTCYANSLRVKGWNQYGTYTNWYSGWYSKPVYRIVTWNYWWKPNWSVRLEFNLSGYGARYCNVTYSRDHYYPYLIVTYTGNNTCKVYDSPYSYY